MLVRIIFMTAILFSCAIYSQNSFVTIVESELLHKTQQGQKVLKEIDGFDRKIMAIVEQEKLLVIEQEKQYEALRDAYQKSKQNLSENAMFVAEQELIIAQDLLRDKQLEAKNHIENHYQAMAAKFCREVCFRYQAKYKFDVVVSSLSDMFIFVKNTIDITSLLIQELQKETEIRSKKYRTKAEIKQLFADLGLIYLDANKIDPFFEKILDSYQKEYYAANAAMSDHYFQKYSSAIAKKQRAPVFVAWISDSVGWGIFAAADIARGDFIQEYVGVLIDDVDSKRDMSYAWNILKVPERNLLFIDPKHEGNEMRFGNHSDKPNIESVLAPGCDGRYHLCYVAKENIKEGQQLLVNYGPVYWKQGAKYEALVAD